MQVETTSEIALATELLAFGADAIIKAFADAPQQECPVQHLFGPGVYIREISIPAGTIAAGHYHRKASLNVLLKGSLVLAVDGEVSVVTAPFMITTGPGRKAVYALTDVIWQSIFATEETDIDKLEDMLVDKHAAIEGGLA